MEEFFLSHGPNLTYVGITFLLVLTGAGLPIPEEVPIVAAGVFSASHDGAPPFLNVYVAYACCLVGALLGDMLVYGIGRFLGMSFLREHPRFAHLLHEEREKQMEVLIQRHGLKVFFVARFMVGIRAPLYLAAGILRVPFRRFLVVDALCASVVVSLVFVLSFLYGHAVKEWLRRSQWTVTIIVVAAVLIAALIYFVRKRLMAATAVEAGVASTKPAPLKNNATDTNRSVA